MAGRGVHRGVYSSLLDHPDFQTLTPQARHVFLTLRISKQAGPAVIFVCYREVLVQQTGLSLRLVERCLAELEKAGWLLMEGRIVWIVNGLRHDPTMRMANPLHLKAILRAVQELPRVKIVAMYCEYYNLEWHPHSHTQWLRHPSPSSSEYRIPKTEDRVPRPDGMAIEDRPAAVETSDAGVTPTPETPEDQRAQIKREVAKLSKRLGWR